VEAQTWKQKEKKKQAIPGAINDHVTHTQKASQQQ
jgi:hypothetical protein